MQSHDHVSAITTFIENMSSCLPGTVVKLGHNKSIMVTNGSVLFIRRDVCSSFIVALFVRYQLKDTR